MSFEEILNYVKNLETSEDPCMICYLGKKETLYKTSCGHFFHKECLVGHEICPYCSKKILRNIKKKNNKNNKTNKTNCLTILQSGKRKGEICNRINCHYHKLKL